MDCKMNNKEGVIVSSWVNVKCFVPGVVLQLQVSQSTDQDVVVFQEHPADLLRGF